MLEVLRKVIQEVNAASNLAEALEIIVDRIQSAMGTHVCSIYLLNDETNRFVFMATRGLNQEMVRELSIDMTEGLVGLVAERAEPINLRDAPEHPRYLYIKEIGEDPFHSFLGVPVIHHRKVLGVLVVQQKEARRFDESEEAFLITLSAQLAGVIAHAKVTGIFQQADNSHDLLPKIYSGMPGSSGVCVGKAVVMYPEADLMAVPEKAVSDAEKEIERFRTAVESTREEFLDMTRQLADRLQPEELALFDAYIHMLDDTAITGEVISLINEGQWAQGALSRVIQKHVTNFRSMDDAYLRERGTDIEDLGARVLGRLQQTEKKRIRLPRKAILVSNELTPAMLGEVNTRSLVGLVSIKGSGNSHVAILARAMGIPAVIGVEGLPLSHLDNTQVVVNGFEGNVILQPDQEQLSYYRAIEKEEATLIEGLEELKDLPAQTTDNQRIGLWVNTGLMTDTLLSLDRGAEGVGLYRTEVQFIMNDRFPTEEEQRIVYREHLEAFAPRPVTMRTLDIGGDKALSYFPIEEANPFLGWRGIRVTLDHPEIFLSQVRAMIRANEGVDAQLRIMLPMVSSVTEVDEAQRLISQCYRELVEEGVEVEMPDVGVMIEVPSAVFQVADIVRRVDFLSVGSNDLVQYILAVDRNNARVAELYQNFHPSVLNALKQVADAAHKQKKTVSICGEMAGNPSEALLLMAMDYDVLSMNAVNLLMVKAMVRAFSMSSAKQILAHVLKMDNAHLIKNYVDDQLREAGLAQLVRSRQGLTTIAP